MLSKKMTFSLMSLITLLAFAFAVPSAMAGFGAKFSVDDVSLSDTNDVELASTGAVSVHISFDHVVTRADVQGAFGTAAATVGASVGNATDTTQPGSIDILNSYGAIIDVAANTITVETREIDALATNARNDGKNFTITIAAVPRPNPLVENTSAYKIRLFLAADAVPNADPSSDTKNNEIAPYIVTLVDDEPTITVPAPVSIALPDGLLIPDAGFKGDTFDVIVTLSEKPKKGEFPKTLLNVTEGANSDGVYLGAMDPPDNASADAATPPLASGRDGMYHQFLVTITPAAKDVDLVIKLNAFEDDEKYTYETNGDISGAGPNEWSPPASDFDRVTDVDTLTVTIKKAPAAVPLAAGHVVNLTNLRVVPAGGYLIVATDLAGTGINLPKNHNADNNAPVDAERSPAERKYNAIPVGLPDLEGFLGNGGTLDLVSPNAGLVISEIMWGSDASLATNSNSQWIEIHNTTAANIATAGDTTKLIFYGTNETLPDMSVAANNIQDRVGTVGAGGYWTLAGKGQRGRTGDEANNPELTALIPTQPIISMQRVVDAAGVAADGTLASSWVQSAPPAANFSLAAGPNRIASPGDDGSVTYPVAPTPDPVVTPDPVATAADIMISEIMVDTGGGRLPQWIELSNVSGKKVSLAGWSVLISNSAADDDVAGSSVSINLSGSLDVSAHTGNTGKGQSLLLVAWGARSSSSINADLVMNVSGQVGETGRYTLISEMGFMIGLVPPQTSGILTYGDAAGNLDEGWELPVSDGGRSSLIRREADALGTATLGTMANGWVLASDTALVSGPATWYGSDEDAGTPGYDAGGPLPVSLSHFRPARDDAGAVVITWSTQSELNNAGFFIKRSQQRDGQFKVINAAMVQGAGTTSEKQFYTYTDTTAQPNVVYYYQIEDVSLDGNRQTLTNGIRLKGHIGPAGKLTTTWGDLKTSQ